MTKNMFCFAQENVEKLCIINIEDYRLCLTSVWFSEKLPIVIFFSSLVDRRIYSKRLDLIQVK